MNLKFCLFLKLRILIPTWCCNSDSKSLFQVSIKTHIQNIVSSCYYDSIPKPHFPLVITIQIWSFASDFSFEFKLEVLLSTSNSNSVQMRRWNRDETLIPISSSNSTWTFVFNFLLEFKLEFFFPISYLSKKLEITFQIRI